MILILSILFAFYIWYRAVDLYSEEYNNNILFNAEIVMIVLSIINWKIIFAIIVPIFFIGLLILAKLSEFFVIGTEKLSDFIDNYILRGKLWLILNKKVKKES